MEYTPHNWTTGETVTSNKLNHMEEGILDAATEINELEALNPFAGVVDVTDAQRNTALANVSNQTANSTTGKMGYKVLDPTKTFTEQVTAENTIYEIRDVFDLGGTSETPVSVTLPAGSTLKFNGGLIKNGTINGNNTTIIGQPKCFALDLIMTGSFNSDIVFSDWFSIVSDCVFDENGEYISGTDNIIGFQNMMKFKNIEILQGYYYCSSSLYLPSNIKINGNNATIKFPYFNSTSVNIHDANNVNIENIVLIGGKNETDVTTESNHGLFVRSSTNVNLLNVSSKFFRGDGVYVGGITSDNLPSENISIINCNIEDNHRNNLSITFADRVFITNSVFKNANGTSPSCGIDVEPNTNGWCKDIIISNCSFNGNGIDVSLNGQNGQVERISIVNTICHSTISLRSSNNTIIDNVVFEQTAFGIIIESGDIQYIAIRNCKIIGDNDTSLQNRGIYATGSGNRNNLTIQNCFVSKFRYGISIGGFKNVIIENNVITDCSYSYSAGTTTTNIISGNNTDSSGTQLPPHSGGASLSNYANINSLYGRSIRVAGTTNQRPTNDSVVGALYFDTTLGKYICWNGTDWINLDGTALS